MINQRRIVADPRLPTRLVDQVGKTRARPARAPPSRSVPASARESSCSEIDRANFSTSNRSYQTSSARIPANRAICSPITSHHRQHRRRDSPGAKSVVPAGDHETGRQAFDVPFPRAGQRLVEIVHVENQIPLGRGKHAKVQQVAIAAQLHPQAGRRRAGQVGRHDRRRSAIKRKRRLLHAAITNRQQMRHAVDARLDDDLDRIAAIGRRRTTRHGTSGASGRAATCPTAPACSRSPAAACQSADRRSACSGWRRRIGRRPIGRPATDGSAVAGHGRRRRCPSPLDRPAVVHCLSANRLPAHRRRGRWSAVGLALDLTIGIDR